MSDDSLNHSFTPTTPEDPLDPPQFGRAKEIVKDVLKMNLDAYFSRTVTSSARRSEIPVLEKYNTMGDASDPYESVLKVVRRYPDILQHLPHVCVLATTLTQRPFSIGPPLISAVQMPPEIIATLPEPYNINDGDQLVVQTSPPTNDVSGIINPTSTFVFRAVDLPLTSTPGVVLAADATTIINAQALFVHASVVNVGGLNYLKLETGGPYGHGTPNAISVLSTSTSTLLTTTGFGRSGVASSIAGTRPAMSLVAAPGTFLASDAVGNKMVTLAGATSAYFNEGTFLITSVSLDGSTLFYANKYGVAEALPLTASWFIGQHDDSKNTARPPANRYGYMFDVGVQVQVLAEDDQTRDQVSDLVSAFFTFFLEQQYFTFLGRSAFDPTILGENYQIVFKSDFSSSAENEVPIGASGTDKIYADVFNITCHLSQMIDRTVRVPYGPEVGTGWTLDSDDLVIDEELPPSS